MDQIWKGPENRGRICEFMLCMANIRSVTANMDRKDRVIKVELYETLQKQADKLYKELKEYFEEELGGEGFARPFITDDPHGQLQNGDEYCNQIQLGEDWFKGEYYYPVEKSDKYVGYEFEI